MAKLTLEINTIIPSEEKIREIASQLEDEMHGRPLNAETAFEFTDELKRRVFDLIEIRVAHPAINGK
ncbi:MULTISPECIES: hypothetical protein [Enterobacter cloacae complex]|uniref:Uncharacterized protein n=1 Tax=Enterobacter cloacae TaxID=550 RepID=A0A4Q2E708_ENTCL|nr:MULTISPECIES: hypothetical protein [Enterobacter cloacae complex]KLP86831.1 hypothetical protein ABF78_20280 [Enterobacter asburiae]RXW27734.1 hypothetical protein DM877_17805 [Enterobacter cloacae]